jgi:hypothetical protein
MVVGNNAMEEDERTELERRLAAARRLAAGPLTRDRLEKLVRELKAQLGEPK